MKRKNFLIGAGILLIAANLRLPITMIPPILPWLQSEIGLAPSMSGWLTTIPLVMFALLSPVIAHLGIKQGNAKVLFFTLLILAIGGYLRVIPNSCFLLLGTILIGIGISGGNVLLPAVIQEYFPTKATVFTSLYTFTMGLVASLGTGLAAPLVKKINLPMTLALFSLIGLGGFLLWAVVVRIVPKPHHAKTTTQNTVTSINHYQLTWLITFFFGTQSLLYYSMLTWLPSFWTSTGFSVTTAGLLATIFQLCGMPMSLLTPIIARKKIGMALASSIVGGGFAVGAGLLLLFPGNFTANVILAIILGIGAGSAFSLCVVFFQKKSANFRQTAQLSGTAQSFGYLLAAVGPALSGYLQGLLHSWTPIFVVYTILGVLLLVSGIIITNKKPLNS
ncbi:MFS transporter [Lactobacillus sp. ESL0677]|uniref:MFS transporter n=1 Tax=Lactobacillus sp. ESL0677 TaxID=2983208 RepID=UPI0023F6EEE2|nr:MFS transporter [Lactobacillus sp. ESL0677]WEV37343.1 MFS transporter [Lactobacillus sp. ESL0677]